MAGRMVVFVGEMYDPTLSVGGGPMPGGPGGQPGYPTHPWVPPYGPAHPIAPGGPPPGIWGPIGNYPDAGFPGPQPGGPVGIWGGPWLPPYVDIGGPLPQPPTEKPPLEIWGPIGNYPDAGFPGPQPGGPVRPTHPIYFPPVIWPPPGPMPAPEHPIAAPPEGGRQKLVEWKTAWSPSTGWVVVGIPLVPVPTPSK